jgi:hypothetical protein
VATTKRVNPPPVAFAIGAWNSFTRSSLRGCSQKNPGTVYATLEEHQDTCPDRRYWAFGWPGWRAES